MTQYQFFTLADSSKAAGVVIVIDVLRAFTTAAYAFDAGVKKIFPVGEVDEALRLRSEMTQALVMGEVDGLKPESFDFSNSPAEIARADVAGKDVIQRTSAGTQGIVRAVNAERIAAASFVVAPVTAKWIQALDPPLVSFIITGEHDDRDGDEDWACAEYIVELCRKEHPNPQDFTARILTSTVGQSFMRGENKYLFSEDIEMSQRVGLFNFFMQVAHQNDQLVMRPIQEG